MQAGDGAQIVDAVETVIALNPHFDVRRVECELSQDLSLRFAFFARVVSEPPPWE